MLEQHAGVSGTMADVDTAEPTTTNPDDVLGRADWPVRTPRLAIRPSRPGDAEPIWRYRRLDDANRFLSSRPGDLDTWRERFAHRMPSTLVIERDDRVIGDLMLKVTDGWHQAEAADGARQCEAELGWVLDPAEAGRGYGTESVRAVIEICFTQLGLRRLVAHCFAANEPSWRLMERLGMRREAHTVRDSLHRDLGWLDGYSYALLAEEWTPATEDELINAVERNHGRRDPRS